MGGWGGGLVKRESDGGVRVIGGGNGVGRESGRVIEEGTGSDGR